MRKVLLQQFAVSVDGFSPVDYTGEGWTRWARLDDPELEAHLVGCVRQVGTHIMGRTTYEEHASYWPGALNSPNPADRAIAEILSAAPKTVFSRSLNAADWAGTQLASGDTADEIAQLRSQTGGDIVAVGGISFLSSLVQLQLFDSVRLYVLPYVAGHGVSIFSKLDRAENMNLASARTFPSGVVELIYDRTP